MGRGAAHQKGTQVIPGASLPTLPLGVQGKGPWCFARDRIPIDLLKKVGTRPQQDDTMDWQEQREMTGALVVEFLYAVRGQPC